MDIFQRTVKIVVASVVAIIVAEVLGLQNTWSAGVVALLSVLDSRMDSIRTGIERFICMLIAFFIAAVSFSVIGYNVLGFGVYLAVFLPVAYKLGLSAGISPCTVLVTHFLTAKSVAWPLQRNEMTLMVIGILSALAVNIWMPSQRKELKSYVEAIEDKMRIILYLMGNRLNEESKNISIIQEEMDALENLLDEMEDTALHEYQNQIFSRDNYYVQYAQMRQEQYRVLQDMERALENLSLSTSQAETLSKIFYETADTLDEENTGEQLLEDIDKLHHIFDDSELPKTRDEFENRAVLYSVLNYFERFLRIKYNFYQKREEEVEKPLSTSSQ